MFLYVNKKLDGQQMFESLDKTRHYAIESHEFL